MNRGSTTVASFSLARGGREAYLPLSNALKHHPPYIFRTSRLRKNRTLNALQAAERFSALGGVAQFRLDHRRLLKPWPASAVAGIVPGRYQPLPLHSWLDASDSAGTGAIGSF